MLRLSCVLAFLSWDSNLQSLISTPFSRQNIQFHYRKIRNNKSGLLIQSKQTFDSNWQPTPLKRIRCTKISNSIWTKSSTIMFKSWIKLARIGLSILKMWEWNCSICTNANGVEIECKYCGYIIPKIPLNSLIRVQSGIIYYLGICTRLFWLATISAIHLDVSFNHFTASVNHSGASV